MIYSKYRLNSSQYKNEQYYKNTAVRYEEKMHQAMLGSVRKKKLCVGLWTH